MEQYVLVWIFLGSRIEPQAVRARRDFREHHILKQGGKMRPRNGKRLTEEDITLGLGS